MRWRSSILEMTQIRPDACRWLEDADARRLGDDIIDKLKELSRPDRSLYTGEFDVASRAGWER